MVPDVVVALNRSASRRSGVRDAKLARQLVHSVVAKPTRAQRATATRPGNPENKGRSSDGLKLTHADFPPLAAAAAPTSLVTTPLQPASASDNLYASPRSPGGLHAASPGPKQRPLRHPSDAPMSTGSTTSPTPTTPHLTQKAVPGPPAGSSKPETGGQPLAARNDQAENPPERPAKPDAPAIEQAGGSLRGSAGSQRASDKRQSPKARGSWDTGKKKEKGLPSLEGMAAAAPCNLGCLRASAVCVQPQSLRKPCERRLRHKRFRWRHWCSTCSLYNPSFCSGEPHCKHAWCT